MSLGLLYGFNTLGAAMGAFAAEAWLIGLLGIRGSAWVAGALALCAAAIALACARWLSPEPRSRRDAGAPARTPDRRLLAAAFLCGAALLQVSKCCGCASCCSSCLRAGCCSQRSWRSCCSELHPAAWPRARGSHAGARRFAGYPALTFAAGAFTLAGYALFDPQAEIERWLAWQLSASTSLGVCALFALRLCFPVALLSGAIFSLQGAALHEALAGDESRSAGLQTLANTLGAILGAAGTGLVALPLLGLERCLLGVALLYATAGALSSRRSELRRTPAFLALASAFALIVAVVTFPLGALTERFFAVSLGSQFEHRGESLVALREARDGTLRLLRADFLGEPLYFRLLSNGLSMTGNDWTSRRYMDMFVTLPLALHPGPKSALLIGYGIGSTAHALARSPVFEEIVIVDPSEETLELSKQVYAERDDDPLTDPRVRVQHEDGRFFLQTTQQRFDLITGEPPPPKARGVVSLYTHEHFQLIRERLREGGMASYWLPLASLTRADGDAILKAFLDVFPDMTLWYGWNHDLIMLGTKGAPLPITAEHFAAQWSEAASRAPLLAVGLEGPEQLVASFVADAAFLREVLANAAPLTDDAPNRLSLEIVPPEAAHTALAFWLDESRSLDIFEASDWIAARMPAQWRREPREWFLDQQLQRWAVTRGKEAAGPRDLQEAIGVSPLAGPVSWLLQSDADRQLIAARYPEDPVAAHHRGAAALARRDFAQAAREFEHAEQIAPERSRLLRAYAACLEGRAEQAAQWIENTVVRRADRAADLQWLRQNCAALARPAG